MRREFAHGHLACSRTGKIPRSLRSVGMTALLRSVGMTALLRSLGMTAP
jgi:hypothetical protein